MTSDVCDSFQAHLFKKELCANCLKPQTQHGVANKLESFKPKKTTEQKKDKSVADLMPKNGGLVNALPVLSPVISKTASEKCSSVSKVSTEKVTAERGSVFAGLIEVSADNNIENTPDFKSSNLINSETQLLDDGAGCVRPPKATSRPVSQQIKRPRAPPPVAPDNTEAQTITITRPIAKAETEDHYYHKYGFGVKDKIPETMKIVSESDAGTETVVVALPYASVDISTNPPNYQLHVPPKLPATPSPMEKIRDSQGTLGRNKSESPKLSPNITQAKPVVSAYEIVEIDKTLQKPFEKDSPTKSTAKADGKQLTSKENSIQVKPGDNKDTVGDGKNTMKKNKSFLKKLFRIKDKEDAAADEESVNDTEVVQLSVDDSSEAQKTNISDEKVLEPESVKNMDLCVAAPLASSEDDNLASKMQNTLTRRRLPPSHAPPPAPTLSDKLTLHNSVSSKEFTKSVDDINSSLSHSVHGKSDSNVKDYGRKTSSLERTLADKKQDKENADKPMPMDKPRCIGRSVSETASVSSTSSPRTSVKTIDLDLKDLGLSSVMEAIEDIFKKNASIPEISPLDNDGNYGSNTNLGESGANATNKEQIAQLSNLNRQGSNLSGGSKIESGDDSDMQHSKTKDKPSAKVKPGRPMQAPPPPPPGGDFERRRSSALELSAASPPSSPLHDCKPFEQPTRGSAVPTAFEVDVILPTKTEKTMFSRDSFAFGTLPRVTKRPSLPKTETKVEKTKKNKEAVKKSRYKTLTEGIGVDIEVVAAFSLEDAAKQTQTLDDKKNKFLNRELPPLPLEAMTNEDHNNGTDDDVNNLYELVPVKLNESNDDKKAYADLDDGNTVANSTDCKNDDKKKKKVTIFDALKGGKKSQNSADYLLPTDDSSDDSSNGKKAPGRPKKPANNSLLKTANGSKSTVNSYVMVYANTVPPSEQFRCALTAEQALSKIATVSLDTLQQLYDLKRREINLVPSAQVRDELHFVDFSVNEKAKAEMIQGPVAFYRTDCLLLDMEAGLIMITTRKPGRDVLDSAHMHFLQPSYTFQDFVNAALLSKEAKDSSPALKASDGRYHAWVWVTVYEKIFTLDGFLAEMRQIIGKCTEQMERYVSYCLAQILDGVLGSHDSKHPVFSLKPSHVIAVTCGERPEKFLVINPACINTEDGRIFKTLFQDLIKMVFYLLNIECPSIMELDVLLLKIPRRSRFSQALRLLVTFMLNGSSFQDILYARNFLEFQLWGPNEDEITTMNLTKDPVGAFSIWLDMARHRTVAKFAREHHAASVELTHMLRFLCSETGTSLRNIALLFLNPPKDKSSSTCNKK